MLSFAIFYWKGTILLTNRERESVVTNLSRRGDIPRDTFRERCISKKVNETKAATGGQTLLAYKFRSADHFDYALDIIINNRLRCSDWRQLNDPMEGAFGYSYRTTDERDYSEQVAEIIRYKKRLLVCSLSSTFDCHLLWAHYASGFRGLAVEVELPAESRFVRVVNYRGVFAHASFDQPVNAEELAGQILSSKYNEWAYEKEVRILQTERWYQLSTPVKRVITGHRMDPAVFEALRIICEKRNITLNRTGIGDEGIDADYVPPLSRASRRRPQKQRSRDANA